MPVAKKVLEGTRVVETFDRTIVTETFKVKELDKSFDQSLLQARDTVGVAIGDPHPVFVAATVDSIESKADEGDLNAIVIVTYTTPELPEGALPEQQQRREVVPQFSFGASLRQITTERDLRGPFQVLYKKGNEVAPENAPPRLPLFFLGDKVTGSPGELHSVIKVGDLEEGERVQGADPAQAQVAEAAHFIRVRLTGEIDELKPFIGNRIPEVASRELTNLINNNVNWHGGDPFQWKSVVQARSQDGGKTWDIDIDFEFDREFHNPVLAYIDPDTGEIPHDITDPGPVPGSRGNGTYRLNWYFTADFSATFQGL